MKGKDFYQILGLKLDASQKEIKQAYRRLARKYHPDVSTVKNAEEKFKTMGEAYDVLRNPKTRSEYDRQNSNNNKASNTNQKRQKRQYNKQSSNQTRKRSFNEARYNEKHAADLNSFFENLFGRNRNTNNNGERSFNIEGKDIHARVMIDLEHSLNGSSLQFTVDMPIHTPQGNIINKKKILNVKIPRGIKEGETIRLAKQGIPGMGAAAGDFFLEVSFNKHDHYTVDGANIYLNLPVSRWDLEQGTKVKVPSPNSHLGQITLTIPKNSQLGTELYFKGHGLPNQQPGDLYVTLHAMAASSNNHNTNYHHEPVYDTYTRSS